MVFKEIAIIGGGVIGKTTAFHLATLGHKIVIIDPELDTPVEQNNPLTGSKASLGILMGNTFRRSSGRAWRLRQRSMELWPKLIHKITSKEIHLELETPLIQFANDKHQMEVISKLTKERENLGLRSLKNTLNISGGRAWPSNKFGGLISNYDGRIDPKKLLACLSIALERLKVFKISAKALSLYRSSQLTGGKWKILLDNNQTLQKDIVILCSSLGSEALLKSIGYTYPINAVLGQAIELVIKKDYKNWEGWPKVLISNGINLIPQKENEILIGATLEPGTKPNMLELKKMQELNGNAPEWLKSASIKNHWYGLRAKPQNNAAPLLENLEPGLILNTGHYRNGILLAPACAEWVSEQINI